MRTLMTILTLMVSLPCAAQTGTVSRTIDEGRVTISVAGVITPDVAASFVQALDTAPSGKPVVVELDSPGGYVKPGYAMVDAMVRSRAAGRTVATLVHGNAACESMCFGLFMAGHPRRAEPGAYFMVHAPRDERSGAISLKTTNEMIARLVGLGASQSWIHTVRELGGFSGRVDYGIRAEQLADNGSNVVTELVALR